MLTNPLKTHLTILQQEGYSLPRFLAWWLGHPMTYTISSKKPLVITPKARFLVRLSYLLFLIAFLISFFEKQYLLASIFTLIFLLAPFVYLLISVILITPYEIINRKIIKNKTKLFLQNFSNLKVIGITGSFGKTTVKDFLYSILENYQQTVKTPESYNTLFGIAKVVKMEILRKTQNFICEMGAYTRGEIKEICAMVLPQYAILTAIGSQHLERFKTLQNTTLAKFELIDAVNPQNALVNLDNPLIKAHLSLSQYGGVKTYSLLDSKADFFVNKYRLSSSGLSFTLVYQNKSLDINSPIFGTSNLYDLVAAVSMSLLLLVPPEVIQKSTSSLAPSPHRLELKKINKATLIDNAFSSNEEGFTAVLNDLKTLKGKKILITPGIIELGPKTADVHKKLGRLAASVFDQIILVGHSERTENLALGIDSKKPITFIENSANLLPLIQDLSHKFDWILLENDLPDAF